MKTLLTITLAGLAIGFAVPTLAQQKDTVDPQIAEQIRAFGLKYDEAFNRSDPGGLAALYTEDAVRVTPHGTFTGRQAIGKNFADSFQRYQSNNYVRKGDRVIAVGNEVRLVGKWSCAIHDTDGRNKHLDGHYSWTLVREGNTWKIRKSTADEGTGY